MTVPAQQVGGNVIQQQTMPVQQEEFNRPPRIWATPSIERMTVPAPPMQEVLPDLPGFSTFLLPVIMMGILLGISVAFSNGSTVQLSFLLPMALFSLITPLTTFMRAYSGRKKVLRARLVNDEFYQKLLDDIRGTLTHLADEQRQMVLITDPDPRGLEERIHNRFHLWERRPDDLDFLSVRVGRGNMPLAVQVQMPVVDVTHPFAEKIASLKADFAAVRDIPCTLSLPKVKSLGITGKRQDVAIFAHGLLCQIATQHSPQDVRIMALYPTSQKHDWEWLQSIPHTLSIKTSQDGKERLLAAGQEEADQLLNMLLEELSSRASKSHEEEQGETTAPINLPHLVVLVHDYVEVRKHPALANAFKLGEQLGVSIIYLVAQEQAIPSECRGILRLERESKDAQSLAAPALAETGSAVQTTLAPSSPVEEDKEKDVVVSYAGVGYNGERLSGVREELLDLAFIHRIAQALSRIRFVEEGENIVNLPTNVRFTDLIKLQYASQLDVVRWWNGSPPFGSLRVPLGEGVNGITWIDLNESMHGPHGIIAGTTGSGKSELLQSLIAGLAVTHHPYLVNFVLVDFKGGAAFKPFEKIPHTVGMVTDLSGRLTERALVALKSELKRREHILNQADAKNITQYQSMRSLHISKNQQKTEKGIDPSKLSAVRLVPEDRATQTEMEPLPHLFIIIDEFAELAKEHPSFMEGLVSVVQKGRSLGVHLILATQKPTGVVSANIWSNLKFRICLRVASLQDSRDMLGRSEAALLPSTIPGRGYFQIGSEVFELFQSARTSLPAHFPEEMVQEKKTKVNEDLTDLRVLMECLGSYKETLGKDLFRPWPDPLPHQISLDEIFASPDLPEVRGQLWNMTSPVYGWLTSPLGLIDLPMEQRQVPFLLDMLHQGGHMLVAGAPGTGKSTFLRTLIYSLVRTHLPSQLHLYIVDFGGQTLRLFERLPHVGGVFGETDEEPTRRLVRKLQGIIEERKLLFGVQQVDDFQMYQRRSLNDPASLQPLPAIVMIINRFTEFRQVHDKEMECLLAIARYGRTYGVFIVLTIDRPASFPIQLLSLIEMRLILRLVETTDSLVLLGRTDAALLDSNTPGRCYLRGKVLQEIQVALPVPNEADEEPTQLLEEMVTRLEYQLEEAQRVMSKHGIPAFIAAPPIRLLPEHLSLDELLLETQRQQAGVEAEAEENRGLRLYLGLEDLSLQPFALDLGTEAPHALVAGGPGSGRTNVLHTLVLMQSTSSTVQADVVLIDFRRSSRILRRLPNVWLYADTEERLGEVVSALTEKLKVRAAQLQEALEQSASSDTPVALDVVPILLVIDDYDQLSVLLKNPLNDLKSYMLQARDLRFSVLVAGAPSDLSRSDALLQQVRSWRLGVLLSGDPSDPAMLGVRMGDQSPGRGYLVRRNQRSIIQIAHAEPKTVVSWVARRAPQASEPSTFV